MIKRTLFTNLKRLVAGLIVLSLLFSCTPGTPMETTGENEMNETITAETADPLKNAEWDTIPLKDIGLYYNPVIQVNAPDTWPDYGVGDPFVMRWNGRYYLYCSTKDHSTGIQCWISDDLFTWKYAGLCATESITVTAYAPEVVYYNGYFYMYTSPGGKGHYVLKSDSPTGPFKAITGNFGHSIDGNVFIDDDGKWYFYSAGDKGIMCYPMSSPSQVSNTGTNTGSYMNGWTEGSMIVKYDGVYYMTYTGNHVWSPGYRIDYATSLYSPTTFSAGTDNPLLVSTDTYKVMGIGHSSTVLSPDLDGYYIVYHSHQKVPQRSMNIDRIVFNGRTMDVLGPTVYAQQKAEMPDIYNRFEDPSEVDGWSFTDAAVENGKLSVKAKGKVISDVSFDNNYTAEYNLLSLEGKAGVIFGYTDEDNYGSAIYDSKAHTLNVTFKVNGKTDTRSVDINGSFGEMLRNDALILFTVRKYGNEYTFFVNSREVLKAESSLSGGAVGVTSEEGAAEFGFVGASDESMQSALKDLYKPVEGRLTAFTCVEEDITYKEYDSKTYVSAQKGDSFTFKVNIQKKGNYDLIVAYRNPMRCIIGIYQGDREAGRIFLSADDNNRDMYDVLRSIQLLKGTGEISFKILDGSADILYYDLTSSAEVVDTQHDYEKRPITTYFDGKWNVENGYLTLEKECGKILYGSEGWGDYSIEADITPLSSSINAGIVVRGIDPSPPRSGESSVMATNFLQGYFIGIDSGSIFLGKHNFNWVEKRREYRSFKVGETYRIKVEVRKNVITVWLNGEEMFTYTDRTNPIFNGMAGFRGHNTSMKVDNVVIQKL